MSQETRTRLLAGALQTLVEHGIAGASARTIAGAAGVNQGLVFYHFGSVDNLLAEACRYGSGQRVARYRDRFAAVASLDELVELGRVVHAEERAAGHVATLGQLLAGAQSHPRLAEATAAGLELWIAELEQVLARVLSGGPMAGLVDVGGLARAMAAGFVGLELYEGADSAGAERALASLEQLALAAAVVEEMGPLAQRALRARLRRGGAAPTSRG
ncbi:TetR/AcrR family transcriptional regulator [Streptomonospora wellingtoniae]|uniref:TetR/AcrR family transcriptional regulator n=1 Tax=Streptomonospora wellingtoniae TaxID=3075544 RepID=A0ABU2KWQ8_9ACTN|nr:TetR/AcrR family transcriptional regulator [Streptomonospora sp. DSM 45055]MDT0303729.1 TetR/AcrR family transcriptional regulator [Streptomonospora sp. DSM 45055]